METTAPSHRPAGVGGRVAVEQDGIPATADVEALLATIAWPPEVPGCAFALERIVVPPEAERDLPADPPAALEALLAHPGRRDVRLLVAVMRDAGSFCLLRQRDHDSDDQVSAGADLAPGLVSALHATLAD
ncbi:MAG: PPA1309 family protein [Dermatophilaceae bacterium]